MYEKENITAFIIGAIWKVNESTDLHESNMININSLNLTLAVKKYFPNSTPNKIQLRPMVTFASSLLSYIAIFQTY